MKIYDLNLDFQIWLTSINEVCSTKGYSIGLLYYCFEQNYTPERFFNEIVYLPF